MQLETELRASVKSPAKVNLTFDVTGDLPGGYHSIVSLFHAISLEDVLDLQIIEGASDNLEMELNAEFVGEPGVFPLDDSNLIAKAAKAFHLSTGLLKKKLLRVSVSKQIPIGAGLAGGSSNAAAVLVGLNELYENPLKEGELFDIATSIGADVPFLIRGGTQLGKGKGEILTPIAIEERLTFVVLKPRQLAVSTPSVFCAYDQWVEQRDAGWRPVIDHEAALQSLLSGNLEDATKCFANVFEPIVFDMHPSLASIKQRLLDLGCWSAQLSGSGPSIFGVVANLEMAHMVRRKFKEDETRGDSVWRKREGWEIDCFIAESIGCGVQLLQKRHN
ncbi:MAG: 4-(cytidine 5'-diphospho)-2-C-methyl-D-erythritol kinase [Candidatus Obscuribacterales bacterium]|nr:4-(cytidine 5'-diphospho)-2-C-methyl-D-erythritol kinase [Candidatus Obscuribacterales bacterium]